MATAAALAAAAAAAAAAVAAAGAGVPTGQEGDAQGAGSGATSGGGGEDGFLDAGDVAYTPYRPSKIRIGKPHPDPVVENTSLAAVQPPDVKYETNLPPASQQQLSEVQMESVIYAGQQFSSSRLPNGERRGFMIGDGAGVGKGRQLAAVILDAWMQGHKRHIWLTISPDLQGDSERDLKDIKAGKKIKVYNIADFNYNDLEVGDGVIFSTYKSLTMRNAQKTKSRLQQMMKWLGGADAEGCILFDEAHKAKNLYHATGPTATGENVVALQDACPSARVIYCSATPCSEPMNMGYMTRLGLWGEGTQFENFKEFLKDIERRGVGAMELVAMQLKAEGMLVSRSLSFEGCSFDLMPLVNNKFQIGMYNAAVHTWQTLWAVLGDAADEESLYTLRQDDEEQGQEKPRMVVGENGDLEFEEAQKADPHEVLDDIGGIQIKRMPFSRMKAMYWGAHQRFFRAMCIAFKVDKAIEITEKALADDMCVVIGLQSTGESNTKDATRRADAELEDMNFLSAPGEILKRFVIKIFWADEEDNISDDDEFSLEPVKKKSKTETLGQESRSPLGWVPPPLPSGEQEEHEQQGSSITPFTVGAPAAPATGDVDLDGDAPPPQELTSLDDDVDEIAVVSPPSVAASDGSSNGQGEEQEAGDMAGGGAGIGDDGCARGRSIRTFTEEEDALLWGSGDMKFERAKSRLHAWLDRIYVSPFPRPPLDDLVNRLGGPNSVAEMTGRQDRMVRDIDGKVRLQKRDAHNTAGIHGQNNFERAEFNHGRKRVAIISDAASAGVSLHANRIYTLNTRRRMHITLELPWSADKAIQQLGRTHRANQFHAPVYTLIMSEVSGETRFSAAVAKRLELLGALTQGDRRASHAGAGELGFTASNVDNKYGKASLDHIYRLCVNRAEKPVVQPPDLGDEECAHIRDEVVETRQEDARNVTVNLSMSSARQRRNQQKKMEELEDADVTFFEAVNVWLNKVDITVADLEDGGAINKAVKGNVPRFLNRILGLRVVQQHVLFDYFHSVLEHHVKEAKRDGTYESGIRSLSGASCEVSVVRALDLPEKTGLRKGELEAIKVTIDKSITFEQIMPIFLFASEETKRRERLAEVMRQERVAAGNNIAYSRMKSKTGFWTRSFRLDGEYQTRIVLVVDYPGRVSTGFSSHALTIWSPCKGRSEVLRKVFADGRFEQASEERALELWDAEIAKLQKSDSVFVMRGPRLLMGWPFLDQTFKALFPSTNPRGKTIDMRCAVVHVEAVDKEDNTGGVEMLNLLSDDEDDDANKKDKDKQRPFIALQLPIMSRSIEDDDAANLFNHLERGTYFLSPENEIKLL